MTRRSPVRCSHGLPAGLCVVPTCEHWDGRSEAQPTYHDRSRRRERQRDRARERYAEKRKRQEQIAEALAAKGSSS